MLTASRRVTVLALALATSTATSVFAQDTATDPNAPELLGPETMPEMGAGRALRDAQDALTGMVGDLMDQGMMDHDTMDGPMDQGMTSPGTMGQGMMCSEMCGGMMGQGRTGPGMMDHGRMGSMQGMGMHDHAMRIMFAIADANDDGGLSLDEIAAIQSRIFNAVDADNDGNVTPEELQAFMRE